MGRKEDEAEELRERDRMEWGINMEIRYIAQADDRLAISKVYEESWKYAYQGIVPQNYLAGIPKGQWASHIEQDDRKNMVMVSDGTIVGTSGFGKSRMAETEGYGEIISIYLLPEYMGKGYGSLLLQAVVDELKKMGFDKLFLWVLEENQNARHFYEKHGFVQSERCLFSDIGGKKLKEVQYCYHNRQRRTSDGPDAVTVLSPEHDSSDKSAPAGTESSERPLSK